MRHSKAGHFRGAFTITEMIVAVGLLVVLITAAGQIFKGAAAAISLSQLNSEVTSNVHATANQLRQDIANMDPNGFLVIRNVNLLGRHEDMLCFVANGSFPNRTGTTAANPFPDHTYGNAALVTYGHGLIGSGGDGSTAGSAGGAAETTTAANYGSPSQWILCRNTTVLLAPSSAAANQVSSLNGVYTVPGYTNLTSSGAAITVGSETAQITAGRWCTAAVTSGQFLQNIRATVTPTYAGTYISDNYCYRFRVLPSVYSSAVSVQSGAYRMHPIILEGCKSFSVEWTDGTFTAGNVLNWYGLNSTGFLQTQSASGANSKVEFASSLAAPNNTPSPGDSYTAIFDWRNPGLWPKALKIVYSATDVNDRLNGGKEFTQVIPLPR